jgi:alpha-D-xyloside xylohydrolase
MYKPVPFFMSSRGYGMFVHTSAPTTLDLGHSYDGAATVYLGDDVLDLFFFFGSPKEILSEYSSLTGRASAPPLWSFGLWMGRETYSSEAEVREVAKKLREQRIPSDVIHLEIRAGPRYHTAATSSSRPPASTTRKRCSPTSVMRASG